MISTIRSGATLVVKMAYDNGQTERIIGFCTALTFSVNNGMKINHTVDSPFPGEIALGSAAMQVTGSMQLIMPKGTTLENAGLVPYRTAGGASAKDGATLNLSSVNNAQQVQDTIYIGGGSYAHVRVYDRQSDQLIFGCDYMKVQSYQVNMSARAIVRADINFVGKFLVVGAG